MIRKMVRKWYGISTKYYGDINVDFPLPSLDSTAW